MEDTRKCGHCKFENPVDAEICQQCHARYGYSNPRLKGLLGVGIFFIFMAVLAYSLIPEPTISKWVGWGIFGFGAVNLIEWLVIYKKGESWWRDNS